MSDVISADFVKQVYARASCLHRVDQVQAALVNMAAAIHEDLQDENPIMLCVLIGGVVLAGKLLTLVDFPLQVDYVHASRYGDNIVGTQLKWIAKPRLSLKNRTVLIVDDILDGGITLTGIMEFCRQEGAKAIKTAVLVDKQVFRDKNVLQKADYTGVTVPNSYVFGYGMDYKGYLRNAQGIFCCAKEDEK
jgi:hypoxanthine phosphoribosyltransferase